MSVPPLQGRQVLQVGNDTTAPFCAMQLADLGEPTIDILEKPGLGVGMGKAGETAGSG